MGGAISDGVFVVESQGGEWMGIGDRVRAPGHAIHGEKNRGVAWKTPKTKWGTTDRRGRAGTGVREGLPRH